MNAIEIQWEKSMVDRGIAKYMQAVYDAKYRKDDSGKVHAAKAESNTSYGVYLLRSVFEPYERVVNRFVAEQLSAPGRVSVAASLIAACDVREVAYLAVRCVLDSISHKERFTSLAFRIAGHIEDHMRFAAFESTHPMYYRAAWRSIEQENRQDYRTKRKILVACHKNAANPEQIKRMVAKKAEYENLTAAEQQTMIDEQLAKADDARWIPWSQKDKAHLGGTLIDLLVMATSEYENGFDAVVNGLDHTKRLPGTGLVEIVRVAEGKNNTGLYCIATDLTIEKIKGNMSVAAGLRPEYLPTLVEPKEWTTPYDGGYWLQHLRQRKPLVKSSRKHRRLLEHAYMPDVYDAVNTAQRVAWQVNGFVLGAVSEQFAAPHGVGMPGQEPIPYPVNPLGDLDQGDMSNKEFKAYKKALKASLTLYEKKVFAEWCRAKRDAITKDNERRAKLLGISLTLRVARLMNKEEEFYYVHTLDYRGRLYPCGTGLNPQGTEISKALLRLKNGTALGKFGFWHMCLHAAGVYGVDKVSLEDRMQWILDHKQEIIRTGIAPNDTIEFWSLADKPYMFLAACQELSEILMITPINVYNCKQESFEGIARDYISHLTGNQDGSCNGIQHFSAMLRDPVGAKAVNMTAQQDNALPEDIYNETCKHVVNELTKDLGRNCVREGNHKVPVDYRLKELLLACIPHMSRKTTKRSTMIIPYGGTKRSCLKHVKDWVDEQGIWNDRQVYKIALPLHHYVWHALDTVVVAARRAMKFLRDIMRVNVKLNMPMTWVTPTGFIAYQDIKEVKSKTVNMKMFGRVVVKYNEETDELNKHKMSSSFPPNFVHSMDASHLMLTTVAAANAGIKDFALVHDSYGVPFGHVELFHRVIREEFVKIYQNNILLGLKQQQIGQFPNMANDYPEDSDVSWGTYDINEVKQAVHFFR